MEQVFSLHAFYKYIKIPHQAQICLKKYGLQSQNMLAICLYNAANRYQLSGIRKGLRNIVNKYTLVFISIR